MGVSMCYMKFVHDKLVLRMRMLKEIDSILNDFELQKHQGPSLINAYTLSIPI